LKSCVAVWANAPTVPHGENTMRVPSVSAPPSVFRHRMVVEFSAPLAVATAKR
jgi:hypothetical protein